MFKVPKYLLAPCVELASARDDFFTSFEYWSKLRGRAVAKPRISSGDRGIKKFTFLVDLGIASAILRFKENVYMAAGHF